MLSSLMTVELTIFLKQMINYINVKKLQFLKRKKKYMYSEPKKRYIHFDNQFVPDKLEIDLRLEFMSSFKLYI